MITRFAPSPTGPLHLGHAYSALLAHDIARAAGGKFLLRIEDIDQQRSKPQWEQQIYEDLQWLGVHWDEAPMRQSDRMPAYQAALDDLWSRGLLYPCSCTRRDIQLAMSAPQEGVAGPDGPVYPGTCRRHPHPAEARPGDHHLRLNLQGLPAARSFDELGPAHAGHHRVDAADLATTTGDIILARRDFGTSYHLAVVLDDAAQGVTNIIRGEDLFAATAIHVILHAILELHTPTYCHHGLIRDDTGKRLAKRDDARAIRAYRQDGATPADIRRMVGL